METKLPLSPTCHLELESYANGAKYLSLNYTERSPAHGYSDSDTTITINAATAGAVILLLQDYLTTVPCPECGDIARQDYNETTLDICTNCAEPLPKIG